MLPNVNVFRIRAIFFTLVGKIEKQLERWNILKISFDSGKALNYVEYGRKKFVVEAI